MILRSVRDDSQNNGLEKGWAAAAQIKSDVCLCGDRCQLYEVLFLHPRGAVAARVGMRDAAPDGMRLSGEAATEHREELPPRWSFGVTSGQTSSEVREAIARFR